eukprot:scaffold29464_cov65-Cyclotella_meneghiniana.AAC.4
MHHNGVSDPVAIRTIVSFKQLYPMGWSISSDDLKNAATRARAYIMRATVEGPLRELCLELMRGSTQFWTDFFAYANNDLTKPVQFGIPEKDCLVLVSEQINIVFEAIYNKCQLMSQFDPHTDAGDYASQIAVYTLQAHAEMDEFSSVQFGGH